MSSTISSSSVDLSTVGGDMLQLMAQLYPICSSITGNGFRKTLQQLGQHLPLEVHEVATGTPAFDWVVPKEWNIRDAFIKRMNGPRIVDFKESNLHVLSYSIPVRGRFSLQELKKHLFTLPEHPDWIPYRTSYYQERWGFCLTHNQLLQLGEGDYEVCIDSTLEPGHLSYGEFYLKGRIPDEILFTCHACHPSMGNDNLSGVSLLAHLAETVALLPRRYSYRFLFLPGTIGPIVWLSRNQHQVHRIKHGLVVACVGDSGRSTYKRSRQGNAEIDRAVIHTLRHSGKDYEVVDFSPYGYDERQFCSPGFNLPVGSLTRTPHGRYAEYHTSADSLDLVKPEFLADSFSKYLSVVQALENNLRYLNTNPKCEPQLGKRGLYRSVGGNSSTKEDELAMLWVLNLSDGQNALLDIAERSGLSFETVHQAATRLSGCGLLEECPAREADSRHQPVKWDLVP